MKRKEERRTVSHEQIGICEICGESAALEAHHKKPLVLGGTNDSDNIILVCHDCHKNEHKYNHSECVKQGMADAKEKPHDMLISYYELLAKILECFVENDCHIESDEVLRIIESCDVLSKSAKYHGIAERRARCMKAYESFKQLIEL